MVVLPGLRRDLQARRSFSLLSGSTGFTHITALGVRGWRVGEIRGEWDAWGCGVFQMSRPGRLTSKRGRTELDSPLNQ